MSDLPEIGEKVVLTTCWKVDRIERSETDGKLYFYLSVGNGELRVPEEILYGHGRAKQALGF